MTPAAVTASEDQEAAAFVAWFRTAYPSLAGCLIHVKNETPKPGKERGGAFAGLIAKQKRMGTLKGTPDYFLSIGTDEMHGLFIEMKKEGGSVKPEQVAFLQGAAERGYGAVVAWGWSAAAHATARYLKGTLPPYVLGVPYDGEPVALGVLTLTGKVRGKAPTQG